MLDQVFRFLLLKVLVASAISQSQIRDFRKFTYQGEDSTSETMLSDTYLSGFILLKSQFTAPASTLYKIKSNQLCCGRN
jgi:hypothetical protein